MYIEYTTVSKYAMVDYITVLNMSSFIKKTLHHIDAWQGFDYSSGSEYTRVLNMPVLHKVLNKPLYYSIW